MHALRDGDPAMTRDVIEASGPIVRVVVADDDPLVRDVLVGYLEQTAGIVVVGCASSGGQAVTLVREDDGVDVVLMDVRMPGQDGLDACRAIRALPGCATRVLLITALDDERLVGDALRARANGLILKAAGQQAIGDAVRAVAGGHVVLTEELGQHDDTRLPADMPLLSDRERRVLDLLCGGWATADIARGLHLSESRVKAHITALMTRLGVDSRLKVVVRAFEWGLVRPGATESTSELPGVHAGVPDRRWPG